MKLLFLNGSLRRGGSTEGSIDHAIEHVSKRYPHVQSQVIHLCEHKVTLCDSCYQCDKLNHCWMTDDLPKIIDQMLQADAIIYAFPVHAFGINSLMQMFLERAGVGYLRFKRPLEGKLASMIITGRRYAHEMAWSQVALNIMLNKMILVGSGFPGVIKNDGKHLRNILIDEEGLLSIEESMDKLVEMHACLHAQSLAYTQAAQ